VDRVGVDSRREPRRGGVRLGRRRAQRTREAVESYRAALRADPRQEASYDRLRALGAAP
jgi:hypothetical protein